MIDVRVRVDDGRDGRPGALEARPDLVIAHVSGYGQDGPDRDRAAFGVIGEAIGGLRYLSNHPPEISDLPPVRVGVSIGDSIAGLYAAFGQVTEAASDLTVEQVAEAVGKRVGAVKALQRRGLAAVARLIDDEAAGAT